MPERYSQTEWRTLVFDNYGALGLLTAKFESEIPKDKKRCIKPSPVACHNFTLDDISKDYIRK